MDSRMDSQANREMVSSLSKPTDARSSSMNNPEGKVAASSKKEEDFGSQLESKCLK